VEGFKITINSFPIIKVSFTSPIQSFTIPVAKPSFAKVRLKTMTVSLSIPLEGFTCPMLKPSVAKKDLKIAARGHRIPHPNAEIAPKRAKILSLTC
jgi:hypothetical protein